MKQVQTIEELRSFRKKAGGIVGLVPTMGFLHEGHLELVRSAVSQCDAVVVSIFVNPSQFGPNEDLDAYPRDLKKDFALLEEEGVDLVWLPDSSIMYPPNYQTWIEVEEVSKPLEGAMRDGHFKGVATIVAKLFNCMQPDKAFFGQKDAQQVAVIQRMVTDLNFNLEIVVVPIAREVDGLARSSRNVYLTEKERDSASVLYRSLKKAEEFFHLGERNAEKIREVMLNTLAEESLAKPQYVSCAHPVTLREIETIGSEGALLSMAVHFGKTRLIDNMLLSELKG